MSRPVLKYSSIRVFEFSFWASKHWFLRPLISENPCVYPCGPEKKNSSSAAAKEELSYWDIACGGSSRHSLLEAEVESEREVGTTEVETELGDVVVVAVGVVLFEADEAEMGDKAHVVGQVDRHTRFESYI